MLTLGKAETGLIKIDLDSLMTGRMLIQANSGAGKSQTLRKLLEETHGKVQHIVVDPDGEFSTLRKHFDYIICAPKGGDVVATPQTAVVLARTLLELRVSAIVDLSELKAHERVLFVRRFFESLMDAPKKLWHPVLVALDEAHIFCPEKGKAESANAVIDMACRGRKRGFCLVAATQRLSKLHKDVAAELLNKLIGRTSLDIDVKRAADELGLNAKEAFNLLRSLKVGTFYVYGSALSEDVQKVAIGKIKSSHGKRGRMANLKTPPPTAKIKKILKKVGDLATQADEEIKTIADLKRENGDLKRKLKQGGGISEKEVKEKIAVAVGIAKKEFSGILKAIEKIVQSGLKKNPGFVMPVSEESWGSSIPLKPTLITASMLTNDNGITPQRGKILDAIAMVQNMGVEEIHRNQVAVFAGVSPKSSSFLNNLGALRTAGLIDYPQKNYLKLTDEGKQKANWQTEPNTNEDLHAAWYRILDKPKVNLLRVIISHWPTALERHSLAHSAGVSPTSSSFSNNLGAMRSLGIINYQDKINVIATELLFPRG